MLDESGMRYTNDDIEQIDGQWAMFDVYGNDGAETYEYPETRYDYGCGVDNEQLSY